MKKIITISLLAALSGIAVASAQPSEAREPRREGQGGARAAQHFQKLDTNGDKLVSRDELLSRITERFDRADVNKDATVTPEERKLARRNWAERGGDQPKTRAELVAKVGERFSKMDTNQDGQLTIDELKSGHGGRHGKRGFGRQQQG